MMMKMIDYAEGDNADDDVDDGDDDDEESFLDNVYS